MKEPRLKVKSLSRDLPRNAQESTNYAAMYRFRTGFIRVPRQCKRCGSIFIEHKCGGPT